MGVHDQSSNRYWSNGTSQHSAHLLLVVGQDGAWQDPEDRVGVGPAGAEIAQDFLVTVIVTGDRAAPGHVPGNIICQHAAQVRGFAPPA